MNTEKTEALFNQMTLFAGGEHGYKCYRIPALVVSTRGTILAFCEARRNSCSDFGDIDIVLKRSFDNGKTFEEMQVIAVDGANTIHNPCPVVDKHTGAIWLPFCKNYKQVFVMNSKDVRFAHRRLALRWAYGTTRRDMGRAGGNNKGCDGPYVV